MLRFRICGSPFHPKMETIAGNPKTSPACSQSWEWLLKKIFNRRSVNVMN